MDEPIYPLKNLSDSIVFQFESIGRNGTFLKEVRFNAIKNLPDFYQLVLADIDKDNNRSVLSESKNQDMNKIMSTVIECMLIFLEKNPLVALFSQEVHQLERGYTKSLLLNFMIA